MPVIRVNKKRTTDDERYIQDYKTSQARTRTVDLLWTVILERDGRRKEGWPGVSACRPRSGLRTHMRRRPFPVCFHYIIIYTHVQYKASLGTWVKRIIYTIIIGMLSGHENALMVIAKHCQMQAGGVRLCRGPSRAAYRALHSNTLF